LACGHTVDESVNGWCRHDTPGSERTVFEDDVYGALQGEPAFASCAPAQTIVVTSMSKAVAPGLRLGAIAGTHPAVAEIARDVALTSWTVSPAMIEVAVLSFSLNSASELSRQPRSQHRYEHPKASESALLRRTLAPSSMKHSPE
jgi:DNA-binding transcriptional MocR family regulator